MCHLSQRARTMAWVTIEYPVYIKWCRPDASIGSQNHLKPSSGLPNCLCFPPAFIHMYFPSYHIWKKFIFLPYFLPKIPKLPYFFKKLHKCPTFSDFLVPLHLELRGTLKSDEFFVLIVPLYLVLRGIFVFFFKILNTPQLGVEWYNKDKTALVSVFACIIYKKIIKIIYF